MGKLENYIVTHRKRSGLSQREVAFLLGCQSGTKVSRYELFRRKPTLEGALACEVVFGVSVRELFAGVYQKVERGVVRRARRLEVQVINGRGHGPRAQKLAFLKALTAPSRRA